MYLAFFTNTMALTTDLSVGSHNVKYTLTGYGDLSFVIDVTETGVTCISVTGGTCGRITPPGVQTSGYNVTGYLAEGGADICGYVGGGGGCSAIGFSYFLGAMYKYIGQDALIPTGYDPGFVLSFSDFLATMYCYIRQPALVPSSVKTQCGW